MIADQLISTLLIPNQPSAHPKVANAREPIVCILGVRLPYWRHGEHGLKVRLEDECIQYWSVLQKGGLPHVALTSFEFCSDKTLLS